MMKRKIILDLIRVYYNQTNRSNHMSMVAVEVIMEMTGLDKNSVRRIGRNIGATQYKDAQVELYDTDDWESFGKPLKKKKMGKEHKKALMDGAQRAREEEAKLNNQKKK